MLLTAPSKVEDKEIAGSLQELRSHLASLGLKDRKKEKILDHIDQLITNRSLEKARFRQATLEKAIEEQDKQLSECSRDLLQLKEQLSRTKKGLQRAKASVDEIHQSLRSKQEKVDQDTSELRDRLTRLSGKAIKVDLSR
jgi:chromosome segregation ATPase